MTFEESIDGELRTFVERSRFGREGAVITDLDGTAVHECHLASNLDPDA